MITWDLETKGLGGDIVIGGVFDGFKYLEFRTIEEFIFQLKNFFSEDVLYSHNGGKYDNRYLLEYFRRNDYKISNILYISNGLIFTVAIGSKKFKFRDSFHILPRSLKNLCASFNVEHKKQDFDMKAWIKKGCPETQELRSYLKDDCRSLYEVLEKFNTEFGVKPKLTIASTAFSTLLKTKYKNIPLRKLLKNFMTKEQEDFVRESYKGGRVEVFQRYAENVNSYDVNSLYPYVMHHYNYPFGKLFEQDGKNFDIMIKKGKLGVARCIIEAPDMDIPYLALRYDNKLVFPVGQWKDVLTSFEIIEARKRGYKIKILEGIIWDKKGRVFKSYVDTYYEMKSTSGGAKKECAKLFLNSSYGKFGQRRTNKTIKTEEEMINRGYSVNEASFDGGFLYSCDETSYQNRAVNPVYATFVTAYARHVLYEGIETVLNLGGEVYYCDTDSIKTNIELPKEMIHSTDLGKWDFEGNYSESVFISPKLYSMYSEGNTIKKGKGVHSENIKKLTFDDYKKLLDENGTLIFENERVTGVMEHFKRKNTDKEKYISSIKTKKKICTNYDKRILIDNSKTKPLHLQLLTDDDLQKFTLE
ncbi:MAG: DNA polymerase [Candidatus Absconditabacteria bacterium]|nr:DNA polymerase [Candidatus Absconditabacteria bacterium]